MSSKSGKARVGKKIAIFSRSTLNIGVIGRARQGKSRLLQSLTGLGTEEIPSGDRTGKSAMAVPFHPACTVR